MSFNVTLRAPSSGFNVILSDGGGGDTGQIKVFLGGVWVPKPVKVWNGSSWVIKPLKFYNGSTFVITGY